MPLSSLATALITNIVSSIIGSGGDAPPDGYYIPPDSGYQSGENVSVNRMFPSGTAVGILAGPPERETVLINGRPFRTAPGLQIRNEQNRILLSSMMTQRETYRKVRYQLDNMGNVWRIWILTQEEIAQANIPDRPVVLPAFLR